LPTTQYFYLHKNRTPLRSSIGGGIIMQTKLLFTLLHKRYMLDTKIVFRWIIVFRWMKIVCETQRQW